jgi:hypothetical protein
MFSRCRIEASGGGGRWLLNTASRGSFWNSSGCFDSSMMSAWRVIAQNGS